MEMLSSVMCAVFNIGKKYHHESDEITGDNMPAVFMRF